MIDKTSEWYKQQVMTNKLKIFGCRLLALYKYLSREGTEKEANHHKFNTIIDSSTLVILGEKAIY